MWNWLSGNLVKVIATALISASPEIKQMLKESLDALEAKAAATTNKWDDILVAMLKSLIGE